MSMLSELYPDYDQEIVEDLRQLKVKGVSAVDLVRRLHQKKIGPGLRMLYFAHAFDGPFIYFQMASLWDPENSDESKERETNEQLEAAIAEGADPAQNLAPADQPNIDGM